MSDSQSILFRAYSQDGVIDRDRLLALFREAGFAKKNPIARILIEEVEASGSALSQDDFEKLYDKSPALLAQILEGNLIISDFKEFKSEINDIFVSVNERRDGELASYIPQLERVDPDKFAVAVCSIDGQRFALGDSKDYFCVQSCSKPITYCIALEQLGEEEVHRYVGREPSGKTFNELTLNSHGLPHNPMINAGAIMSGALIDKGSTPAERFDGVLNHWQEAAGGEKIGFNNAVYLSERQTGDRNFALGYFMREKKAFPPDTRLEDVLEFYFQCCSIETTVETMSVIAATLANGGQCPLTGKSVFRPEHVKNCLSLMLSCGMYDFSGEFAFSVGMPAKSGVSGAILLVVPNTCGIAIWSPRLDELGNSVRGVEFCRQLVSRFRLHTFDQMVGLTDSRLDPRRSTYEERLGGGIFFLWACAQGDTSEMRRLVARGVDPGMANYDGRTGLHIAASAGQIEAIRYLLKIGVPVNPEDRWGNRPLDDALREDNNEAAVLLKEHGARKVRSF